MNPEESIGDYTWKFKTDTGIEMYSGEKLVF
jgi:hypothetical protein